MNIYQKNGYFLANDYGNKESTISMVTQLEELLWTSVRMLVVGTNRKNDFPSISLSEGYNCSIILWHNRIFYSRDDYNWNTNFIGHIKYRTNRRILSSLKFYDNQLLL